MNRTSTVLLTLFALSANPSFAHDVFVPQWRGEDGTTFQHFRFDSPDNPAAPELINNYYGTASATITVASPAEGWLEGPIPGFGSQTGLWDLGLKGTIAVEIDNSPPAAQYEEIRVQVTYLRDFWPGPNVTVAGAEYIHGESILIEELGMGPAWYLDQSDWRLEPITEHISVIISADMPGPLIDQVVIDVKPTPAVCIVNFNDIVELARQWLQSGLNLPADFNKSGTVDLRDFARLAALWLQPCPADWPF